EGLAQRLADAGLVEGLLALAAVGVVADVDQPGVRLVAEGLGEFEAEGAPAPGVPLVGVGRLGPVEVTGPVLRPEASRLRTAAARDQPGVAGEPADGAGDDEDVTGHQALPIAECRLQNAECRLQ